MGTHVISSGTSVVLTSDGGYLVAGTLNGFALSSHTPYVSDNTWLVKFNSDSTFSTPEFPTVPVIAMIIVVSTTTLVLMEKKRTFNSPNGCETKK